MTNGFSVIVAQHFGSRDMHALRKSVAVSMRLSFCWIKFCCVSGSDEKEAN